MNLAVAIGPKSTNTLQIYPFKTAACELFSPFFHAGAGPARTRCYSTGGEQMQTDRGQ